MAAGDTLVVMLPQHAEPPAANYGSLDRRNAHPVYDMALNEIAVFSFVMPRQYSGDGVVVYLHYAMTSASEYDVKLETDFERIGDGQQDIDGDGFTGSPQNTGDVTVPGTLGNVDIIDSEHTDGAQIDNLAVGEGGRLWVRRIAVAGDDAAGNLELRFIEIKETL